MKKEAVTVGGAKILRTSISFDGDVESFFSQIVVPNLAANVVMAQFTKKDYQTALRKVSQRRSMPVGEHIREAIQVMKAKEG